MAIGNPQHIRGTSSLRNVAHAAHGVVISIALIIWFPLGVFILRYLKRPSTVRFHALWQCFGLFLLLIGFGLGLWLTSLRGGLNTEGHVILGTVVTVLFLLQPVIGWLHHKHFAAKGKKNYKRQIHVWLERILLVLSVINGGTGFQLADNTTAGGILYGVVSALMVVAYFVVWWWSNRDAKRGAEKSEVQELALTERVQDGA